jgi:hypothetical protein
MYRFVKYSVIFLFIFFITVPSCEKIDMYIPKPECKSDWLTNALYHTNVYKPTDVDNLPETFTAIINGRPWKADSSSSGYYYKGHISVWGSDKNYWIGISFNENDFENAKINILNYPWSEVLEKELNLIEFDPINGTISINFKARVRLKTSYNSEYSQVVIENGKINNVKFEELSCRPNYVLQDTDSPLKGIWHLIEITDCTANSQYFPPCGYNPFISFDTLNSGAYNTLPYKQYVSAWCANEFGPSYKLLNDTTIVISQGSVTQVGIASYAKDYENLFFSLLCCDTLILKRNKNLLEIRKRGNIFLRFYK